jgi:hypothetical protein
MSWPRQSDRASQARRLGRIRSWRTSQETVSSRASFRRPRPGRALAAAGRRPAVRAHQSASTARRMFCPRVPPQPARRRAHETPRRCARDRARRQTSRTRRQTSRTDPATALRGRFVCVGPALLQDGQATGSCAEIAVDRVGLLEGRQASSVYELDQVRPRCRPDVVQEAAQVIVEDGPRLVGQSSDA